MEALYNMRTIDTLPRCVHYSSYAQGLSHWYIKIIFFTYPPFSLSFDILDETAPNYPVCCCKDYYSLYLPTNLILLHVYYPYLLPIYLGDNLASQGSLVKFPTKSYSMHTSMFSSGIIAPTNLISVLMTSSLFSSSFHY